MTLATKFFYVFYWLYPIYSILDYHSIKIGLSVRASIRVSHFECFFLDNCWADFDDSWRVAEYTMQKYESKNLRRSRGAAPSRAAKTGSAHISKTVRLILTRLDMWADTPCRNIILKFQDDRGAQRWVIALSLGSVEPRHEAPGIEVRSAAHQGAKCLTLRSTAPNCFSS